MDYSGIFDASVYCVGTYVRIGDNQGFENDYRRNNRGVNRMAEKELFGNSEQLEKDHFADPGKMVGDLVSRQAAIETVRKAKSIGQAYRMLVQLPPAQRWIPCSTALPEHDGEYLVTIKAFTIDQAVYADIDIARYEGGKWHKGFPVTAWQPLPTPYREGGQDE